jgi:hypothetical protein
MLDKVSEVLGNFLCHSVLSNDQRSHAGSVTLNCNRDALPALADAAGSPSGQSLAHLASQHVQKSAVTTRYRQDAWKLIE